MTQTTRSGDSVILSEAKNLYVERGCPFASLRTGFIWLKCYDFLSLPAAPSHYDMYTFLAHLLKKSVYRHCGDVTGFAGGER